MEVWFAFSLSCLFAFVFSYIVLTKEKKGEDRYWNFPFFILVLVDVCLYLLVPDAGYLKDRFNLFPFFALILWFAVQTYSAKMKQAIMILSIGISLSLLCVYMAKYSQYNEYIEEYLSGKEFIEANSTMLPYSFSKMFEGEREMLWLKVDPFYHLSGLIAAQRHVVDLSNYEAGATDYFPVMFRPRLNAYNLIGRRALFGLAVDFAGYERLTGRRVDYILLWGIKADISDKEYAEAICWENPWNMSKEECPKLMDDQLAQLKKKYRLIFKSEKHGLMQIYRRNEEDG
jgi:hypothetical protein